MGPANCKVKNDTERDVFVRTYNAADHVFDSPCHEYWLSPGETKEMHASADARGLKVAWRNQYLWVDNGTELTVTNIRSSGETCDGDYRDGPSVTIRIDNANQSGLVFARKAIWCHPLPCEAAIEVGRAFADVFTLGLAEISRATAGNAWHWFFVAHDEQNCRYLVANFGRNGCFVTLATSLDEALSQGTTPGMAKSQVKMRENWVPCSRRVTTHDLLTIIQAIPHVKKEYKFMTNNCQHFSGALFDQV